MRNKFYQLIAKIILSLLIFALLLDVFWLRNVDKEPVVTLTSLMDSAWQDGFNFSVKPKSALILPQDVLSKLNQGELISVSSKDKGYYFYKLRGEEVLVIGPIFDLNESNSDSLPTIVFYIGVIIILFILVQPAVRDFSILTKRLSQFSSYLSWKPIALPHTSLAYPISHTVNQMANKIQALIETQRRTSRMVGHELRTPISRLNFSIENIKKYCPEDEILSMQEDCAELANLTEEFLQFAKLQHDIEVMTFSLMHARPLILSAINKFAVLSHKQIVLNVEPSLIAPLEANSFLRLTQNLISNAVKHAKNTVEITLYQDKQSNEYVLTISDDGDGFDGDERLGTPFYQQDKNLDGYGLGLEIVKMISSSYSGTLQFSQCPVKKGAMVIFRWPPSSHSKAKSVS
jgi:two-component system, OmpR family, sensor kinase